MHFHAYNNPHELILLLCLYHHVYISFIYIAVEELRKIGLRPLDIGYDEFMDMQNPSINLCRNCCKMKYNCECEHKMDTLQFEPDPSGNCMRLVNTGEQYKIIGGNIVEGPNNETQLHLTEISKEMLQGNIIQLQGATLPEDGSPLISRNPLREPPTLDYKIVPEGNIKVPVRWDLVKVME